MKTEQEIREKIRPLQEKIEQNGGKEFNLILCEANNAQNDEDRATTLSDFQIPRTHAGTMLEMRHVLSPYERGVLKILNKILDDKLTDGKDIWFLTLGGLYSGSFFSAKYYSGNQSALLSETSTGEIAAAMWALEMDEEGIWDDSFQEFLDDL